MCIASPDSFPNAPTSTPLPMAVTSRSPRAPAGWLAAAEARRLRTAGERVLARDPLPSEAPVIAAGVGRFLLPPLAHALGRELLEFGELLSVASEQVERVSDCAPAVAVGW